MLALCAPAAAGPPYLCVSKKKYERGAKVAGVIKNSPCGAKQLDISSTLQGPAGATGATGAAGDDGQMRIYGDGSAGALTISADTTLNSTDHLNLQYTDITINAGTTLTVQSGTVLRCTGTFTNNGTLRVGTFAYGSRFNGVADTNTRYAANRGAHPGVARSAAMNGEISAAAGTATAGLGGISLSEMEARQIRYPGGVGGGGGGFAGTQFGAHGGGTLVVLCAGPLVNNGSITANGDNGSAGAGAGGILIFASPTAVTNGAAGVISANGGKGQDSNIDIGASGGGGGGIIHFISPAITIAVAGNVTANGGAAGSDASNVTADPASAGGGGGACGGDGGSGGTVAIGGATAAASAGGAGYVLQTPADPTALF